MKKTKIVCTIGPSSDKKEVLRELVLNGMNVARLNFSHGCHEDHQARIDAIKEVRQELGIPVAIMLDTKGPEIRTGKFAPESVELKEGQIFTLTIEDVLGDENRCSISYKGLPGDVEIGDRILIDDGQIELEVIEIPTSTDITCKVNNPGIVKNNKGVNVPGIKINLPAITKKDTQDILFAIQNGLDFIAASFIRKADDVLAIRRILEENNGQNIHIISKIENQEGVDNMDEIIQYSDGIMVARGDLGVEIPTEMVPHVQKKMIAKCNTAGKAVITATQMLDSMIRNPRPTRAETTDIANAILDGTDAIMLSGETAAGKYPVEAVRTMAKIAKTTEAHLNYNMVLVKWAGIKKSDVTNVVGYSTCSAALKLDASAIITATATGFTARNISQFRPTTPIIAATDSEEVMRKLCLAWGVYALVVEVGNSTDEIFDMAISAAQKAGYVKDGELVIFTAGVPIGVCGSTNLMKVHLVGENISQ
ncbi:pyruvate kinase [Wukongibacter baidiensis]|uniref:pyruvate kinase n=1 Tax=Wukongibacter baidiensis TaxID=1723361 RepID=UPI003D7F885B